MRVLGCGLRVRVRVSLSDPEVRVADVCDALALSDLGRREIIIPADREVLKLATLACILGLSGFDTQG